MSLVSIINTSSYYSHNSHIIHHIIHHIIITIHHQTIHHHHPHHHHCFVCTTTTIEILLSVGDLDDFPEEISDLFVQCFSQLTVQVTTKLLTLTSSLPPFLPSLGVITDCCHDLSMNDYLIYSYMVTHSLTHSLNQSIDPHPSDSAISHSH